MPPFAQVVAVLIVYLVKESIQQYSCGSTHFILNHEIRSPVIHNAKTKFHSKTVTELLGGGDLCNRTFNQPDQTLNSPFNYIVATCNDCNCQNYTNLYDNLKEFANQNKVQSLLVVMPLIVENVAKAGEIVQFTYSTGVEPNAKDICNAVDENNDALRNFSKTSVLFVSISFIILMVISLAWLVFYYVQRFRYAHAKDRMQRRLFNAAKKALTRIPIKPVKTGDKELDGSDCPVCIDPYRAGDIVRMLPCRHVFHKTCVDPWLLEHRTCPMCKSDILKAFGYQVNVNTDRRRTEFSGQIDDHHGSIHVESDRLSSNSIVSESNGYPYPVVTEIHDPFGFTPSTSPQLVQVMNEMNARAFSIIPLTVHSSGNSQPQSGTTTSLVPGVSGSHSSGSSSGILRNTPGSSRKMPGRVVNLVHVRSRSLSQSQIPTNKALTSLRETSPIISEDRSIERQPSALFRSSVPSNITITNEISPCENKPLNTSAQVVKTRINVNPNNNVQNKQHNSNDVSPVVQMAVSQKNIATPPLTVMIQRPISLDHSVKTIGTHQQSSKNLSRRVPGQPAIGVFPIMPPMEVRPITVSAVFSDANAKSARMVSLTPTTSIEPL